jgi:hypothetical protein
MVSVALVVTGSVVAAASVGAAKTVPAKTWATSVCQDFGRWEAQLTKAGSPGTLADPVTAKTAITKFLGGALKATDRLAKDLKSAGVPSIKNGKAIAAVVANAVNSLRTGYATANTSAAALPTTDPVAFGTAAKALASQLQTSGRTMSSTLSQTAKQYPDSALNKAFGSDKACKAIA